MWAALLVATMAAAQLQLPARAGSQMLQLPPAPASPCPDVFQYTRGSDGVWRALLWAWPPPRAKPIRLRVELSLEAALPNKYAGRILLRDDKDVVAQKILAGSQDRIRYAILFPLLYPIPSVDRITVNDDVMCVGPRVVSPVLTKISLEHTLYPTVTPLNSGVNVVPGTQPGIDYSWPELLEPHSAQPKPQQPRPQPPRQQNQQHRPNSDIQPFKPKPVDTTQPKPPYRETTTEHPQNYEHSANICGRSVAANELILHGRDTDRGEWPWITAIFVSADVGNLEFQCSGTLINRRHVVTAGHCVKPRDQPEVESNQLVVYLGLHNLRRIADIHSQAREVDQIFVHPDYAANASFDADVAVLRLSVPATYTRYVRPICLWSGSPKLEIVVGMRGMVVGWGRDEMGNKATNEPRQIEMPIVSQEECLHSQPDFITITSKRTFCAGFRNDSGPCNGDSGSGLFLRFRAGEAVSWYLRGITSVSLYDRQQNRCDLRNYVVFTDMAKYGSWMHQFTKDEYK